MEKRSSSSNVNSDMNGTPVLANGSAPAPFRPARSAYEAKLHSRGVPTQAEIDAVKLEDDTYTSMSMKKEPAPDWLSKSAKSETEYRQLYGDRAHEMKDYMGKVYFVPILSDPPCKNHAEFLEKYGGKREYRIDTINGMPMFVPVHGARVVKKVAESAHSIRRYISTTCKGMTLEKLLVVKRSIEIVERGDEATRLAVAQSNLKLST